MVSARWARRGGVVLLVIVAGLAFFALSSQDDDAQPIGPVTHNGQRWRIAYYEGGPFFEYTANLRVLVAGLAEIGWMESLVIPDFEDSDNARLIWDFLGQHAQSDFIEFVPDAFWSAAWDDDQRRANQAEAIQRLAGSDNIDLVIAMGTWAGLDLANNEHHVPTVVTSTSNALAAGIIQSASDSGFDHVMARIDPERYVRQVRLFHDIVRFDKLGVIFQDTPEGRTYANLPEIEQVSRERGFEIETCISPETGLSDEVVYQDTYRCLEELAPSIDAMWLTNGNRGIQTKYMPEMLDPLFAYNVPTWSVVGAEQVARGVLVSVTRKDLSGLGRWEATVIARIFNGAKPRDLNQIYEMSNAIAINLETARRIGFEPPEGIVKAADEVFTTIEAEQE